MSILKFSGTLFLVVGPSGSGKDSLINAARNQLLETGNFIFPKRFITRFADSGEEKHIPISEDEFSKKLQAGDFAMSWEANGFRYGVPRNIEKELDEGRSVVLNVSRGVVNEALKKFASVKAANWLPTSHIIMFPLRLMCPRRFRRQRLKTVRTVCNPCRKFVHHYFHSGCYRIFTSATLHHFLLEWLPDL